MQKLSTKNQAFIELIIAGFLWGFGFIGAVWALESLSPSAIVFYRFMGAFLVSLVILVAVRTPREVLLGEFKLALGAGALLALTLILQTWGLQYTTATKSAFITILYVLIVPVISMFVFKDRLHVFHWICIFLSFIGVGLIVQVKSLVLETGDFLTFLCAIAAAFHILYVGQIAPKSKNSFALNAFQSLWCAAFALTLFPFEKDWTPWDLSPKGWWGLGILTFGSSLLAFYLQFRAQRVISPSLVSLLFLLESPFSAILAVTLLGEHLSTTQILGALLIFVSCAVASQLKTSPSQNLGHG